MPELNLNALPLPPHERFKRGVHGGIKVNCEPEGPASWTHIETLHVSERERWYTLAVLAFDGEWENCLRDKKNTQAARAGLKAWKDAYRTLRKEQEK